jgi:hypothetical protein
MRRTSIHPTIRRAVSDEGGTALPIALIVLVILTSLSLALSSLATTEPVLSRNHLIAAQARGYGEAGIELALWALNNPAHDLGIPTPMSSPATSTDGTVVYDGDDLFRLSPRGGFKLAVTTGGATNERTISVVGWAPDSAGLVRAAKKVTVTLMRLSWGLVDPPCALCVRGRLDVGGNARIDAYPGHTGVATCGGTTPIGGSASTGVTAVAGNAKIWGPDDDVENETADMPSGVTSPLPSMTWADMQVLRSIAQANGTYYRGAVAFNESTRLPANGGIVFVDTTTGDDLEITPEATPLSEMGRVTISGNITWSGWLIVNGDITVSGTVELTGNLYARNDFVFNGNGTITGAVTAENKLTTLRSSVDSSTSGSSRIVYNCPAAKNGNGTVSTGWLVKPQTYHEVDGQQ